MSLSPSERERLDALVAAYRKLPRAEPSAEIDAAVLRGARAALRTSARPRWPALLATAATMTLAVGLAWQLREAEDRIEAERPAASSAPAAAPAESAVVPPPAAYEDSVAGSRDAREDAADADRAAVLEDSAVATEPPARNELGAAATTTPSSRGGAEQDAAGGPRPKRSARDVPARPFPAEPAEPAHAPKLARDREAAEAKAEARSIDAPLIQAEPEPGAASDELLLESVPAPAAAPITAPADAFPDRPQPPASPAPPPPPPAAAAARAPAPVAVSPALEKQVEATGQRQREARPELGLGQQRRRADAATTLRDPEEWLDEILQLLRAGNRARAIEALRDFRAAYPEVELPPELRDLPP